MKAVLLAAGEGSRLRPLTQVLPKCLMPIQGVPLLHIWLQTLAEMEIEEILVNTHYMAEMVTRFLEGHKKIQITFEEKLLGTAGTLRANRHFLADSDVFVAHADNLTIFDPRSFLSQFQARPKGVVATMMTFETDSPKSCGILELDQSGVVQRLHEKTGLGPGNLANGAVYIFSKESMESILAAEKVTDISTQVLPTLMGKINTYHNTRYHRDIGTVNSYLKATTDLMSQGYTFGSSDSWVDIATVDLWNLWVKAWTTSMQGVKPFNTFDDFQDSYHVGRAGTVNLIFSTTPDETIALKEFMRRDPNLQIVTFRTYEYSPGARP